ncbi:HAD family hydrolase [Arsenicicoccus cauae]|uniref:HAD hydrolase-like protein n=1 Tax=Arsenicicoccus cauae TaxID=2663847 RepID=A0A6I3IIC9_9MICO|nr:HAD hydrolase-like protein [Arsenicicoccus cauae]MTB72403.1 HAD hydrolase-like protein [Arsenicicoccus cauae]
MPSATLLIDLDGPLTKLFPDPAHLVLAEEIAGVLATRTGCRLEAAVDHVQVLRSVRELAPELLPELERRATAAEVRAARQALPAPGAVAFLHGAHDEGYAVAVVSNNADEAVRAALQQCGVLSLVDHVAARHGADVDRLKPEPALLLDAMAVLGSATDRTAFYGDSVSDMVAASRAGVRGIGVSSDPRRRAELVAAGAVAVVPHLGDPGEHLPVPARTEAAW